ncbi:Protein of unknown function [Lactobacillus helveticus CIRM-BIA 951]|uniref:Uncharacterized protein n=1 Tax=Lactobacillus helveticus CIRM-BIA 951 TaxID=1226334 RepID=U6F2A3_LACHE|nr:Protein of unknown function [Lactobacillus helveticus CIRM-BIA 951]
MNRKQPLCRL